MILLARRAPSATVGIRGTKLRAAIVLQREDATAKPKILPPFCAESRAKNHIMIYCLVMLKVMGLQIDGSSRDGTPWARATNNVKKPQSQMCESCRKLDL